jgi:hypothetical protein
MKPFFSNEVKRMSFRIVRSMQFPGWKKRVPAIKGALCPFGYMGTAIWNGVAGILHGKEESVYEFESG